MIDGSGVGDRGTANRGIRPDVRAEIGRRRQAAPVPLPSGIVDLYRYGHCRAQVFGSDENFGGPHVGRRVPTKEAMEYLLRIPWGNSVNYRPEHDYGPEHLALLWAIENNFDPRPLNTPNHNGTIDIGPVAINLQEMRAAARGLNPLEFRWITWENRVFGPPQAQGVWRRFDGDIVANLEEGLLIMKRRSEHDPLKGVFLYNRGQRDRQGLIQRLWPQLRAFFDCLSA